MNNQLCMVWQTLTDLNFGKLYYYPFMFTMRRRNGSYNTVEDPFGYTKENSNQS